MKLSKIILGFLLIFTLVFASVQGNVLAIGYDVSDIKTPGNGWTQNPKTGVLEYTAPADCPPVGCTGSPAGSYAPGQDYAGYYEWPPDSGTYYEIGGPADPIYNPGGGGGGGTGPEDDGTGACAGVYSSCFPWRDCSTTCGPGTQPRTCFDTGCGAPQEQSQACMVNDPNVWGTPNDV